MRWFKHSGTLRHDPKIRRVLRMYGAEGYALYCYILEAVAESLSEDSPLPALEETSEDIAEVLRLDSRRIEEMARFMSDQKLFGFIEGSDVIVVPKILDHMDEYARKAGKAGKIRRALQSVQIEAGHAIPEPEFPEPPPRVTTPPRPPVDQLIETWNGLGIPPVCPYNSTNLPRIGDVAEKIRILGAEVIEEAIRNYGEHYGKVEAKYRPGSFWAFVASSVDRWTAAAEPWKRFEDDVNSKAAEEQRRIREEMGA
jgi:hypothetical protein